MDHTVFGLQSTPHLPLPRKAFTRDGATTDSDNSRLIAAYYSFIDPREDERLSWPSWLAYSGRFTQCTGLTTLSDILAARRISVFGHIAQLENDVPAHMAL